MTSDWMGLLPFLLFCLVFEIVPILFLMRGSVIDKTTNQFTIQHYLDLKRPLYINSFLNSIKTFGVDGHCRRDLRYIHRLRHLPLAFQACPEILITLSDVTTNFAGAPLAFAFVVILGMNGVITQFLLQYFSYELYPKFSIYSFSGLILAYVYFQLPLMVLLILPAFAGIKKEWQESAQSLGANTFQILAVYRHPGVDAVTDRRSDPSFCERLRRLCHRLHPGRGQVIAGDTSDRVHDRR